MRFCARIELEKFSLDAIMEIPDELLACIPLVISLFVQDEICGYTVTLRRSSDNLLNRNTEIIYRKIYIPK